MRRSSRLAVPLCIALCAAGCAPAPFGKLSDQTVVVAGKSGGAVLSRPKPAAGLPLAGVLEPGSGCVPGEQLLQKLGPVCDHETENAAGISDVQDPGNGKPKRRPEVRWYCDQHFTVRVVLSPCDVNQDGKNDGLWPSEVAVALRKAAP
jgi:hypothetical protein